MSYGSPYSSSRPRSPFTGRSGSEPEEQDSPGRAASDHSAQTSGPHCASTQRMRTRLGVSVKIDRATRRSRVGKSTRCRESHSIEVRTDHVVPAVAPSCDTRLWSSNGRYVSREDVPLERRYSYRSFPAKSIIFLWTSEKKIGGQKKVPIGRDHRVSCLLWPACPGIRTCWLSIGVLRSSRAMGWSRADNKPPVEPFGPPVESL